MENKQFSMVRYEDGTVKGEGLLAGQWVLMMATVDRNSDSVEFNVRINQSQPYFEIIDVPENATILEEITKEMCSQVIERVFSLEVKPRIH